jgi:hypothetical protein
MAPIPADEFARRVRRLSADERTALVADLLRARGRTVERDGRTVVADGVRWVIDRPGDDRDRDRDRDSSDAGSHPDVVVAVGASSRGRRLLERLPGRRPNGPGNRGGDGESVELGRPGDDAAGADGPDGSGPGRRPAPRVVGPSDLRSMALYAVGVDARARLFDSHLDCEPVGWSERPDDGPPGSIRDRLPLALPGPDRRPGRTGLAFAAGVVGVVLLVVATAIAPGVAGFGSAGPHVDGTGGDGPGGVGDGGVDGDRRGEGTGAGEDRNGVALAGTGDAASATGSTEAGRQSDEAGGSTGDDEVPRADDPSRIAPGVGFEGITDADRLAVAHGQALDDRSYVWTVSYRELRDGEVVASQRAVVEAINWSVYRTSIVRNGTPRALPSALRMNSAYADGQTRYVRTDDGVEVSTETTVSGYAPRSVRLVRDYLTVTRQGVSGSVEENGTRFTLVQADGDPDPEWSDVATSVIVTETGFVTALQRRHVDRTVAPNVTVVIEWQYRELRGDRRSLSPPDWVPTEGANRTARGTNRTTTASAVRSPSTDGPRSPNVASFPRGGSSPQAPSGQRLT